MNLNMSAGIKNKNKDLQAFNNYTELLSVKILHANISKKYCETVTVVAYYKISSYIYTGILLYSYMNMRTNDIGRN